jgi:hypothetical protein
MELGEVGACMPKMAIPHFRIATPSQSAAFLHGEFPCEEFVGDLATISSRNPIPSLQRLSIVAGPGGPRRQLDSDDLIAAFGHRDRVRQIDINNPPEFL